MNVTPNPDADAMPPSTKPVGAEEETDASGLKITAEESREVSAWHTKIRRARAFDDAARKLYARNRKHARGDSSALVTYPLIQAYIDILVAFLYAKDPDVDALPSEQVLPPQKDADDYGRTMQIIIKYLLRSAKLKRRARRWVRSALTVGIGWLKVTWQEHFENDPQALADVKDAQDNLARIERLRSDLAMGKDVGYDGKTLEDRQRELEQEIKALQGRTERMVARGLAIDLVRPEDMTTSEECESLVDNEEARWQAQRYFLHRDEALDRFPRVPSSVMDRASKYSPRKPLQETDDDAAIGEFDDTDADHFVSGTSEGSGCWVCCHEVYDAFRRQTFTVIEGINRYAREPEAPNVRTRRFNPFFPLSFTEIDGERHPQSLIQRSYRLQDEINRVMNAFVEHRRRIKPKTIFDSSQVTPGSVKKLQQAQTAEMVPVKFHGPNAEGRDLRGLLVPLQYPQIDMAIYDVAPYVRALETIWGIQEALTGGVSVAKTATEADIQDAGMRARSGDKRDALEGQLQEIAEYVTDIAAMKITVEDAREIAGNGALWFQVESLEELDQMIQIDVRAGSSGKPNSRAMREAWAAVQPQIKELLLAIGQLRGSMPTEIADKMEELLVETAERSGERVDPRRFIPQVPQMEELPEAMAAAGGMPPGPDGAPPQGGPGTGRPPPSGAGPAGPAPSGTPANPQDKVAPAGDDPLGPPNPRRGIVHRASQPA